MDVAMGYVLRVGFLLAFTGMGCLLAVAAYEVARELF